MQRAKVAVDLLVEQDVDREAGELALARDLLCQREHRLLRDVQPPVVHRALVDLHAAVVVAGLEEDDAACVDVKLLIFAGEEGAAARNEADDIVFVEVVGEGLRDPVETVGLDLQRLVIGDGLVFLLHAYPSFYRYFSTARGQLLVKYLHFRENFSCRGAKFLPIPIFRPV